MPDVDSEYAPARHPRALRAPRLPLQDERLRAVPAARFRVERQPGATTGASPESSYGTGESLVAAGGASPGPRVSYPSTRAELPERLPAVLHVIYVVFTEAYAASGGPELMRPQMADEAIRLARILHSLLPDECEGTGLLALLLLVDARRDAWTDESGAFVLLADQDRSRWNQAKIQEGTGLVDRALRGGSPGPYTLQAAIAALHNQAATIESTDWPQIVALYGVLLEVAPSALVRLNRAVAVGMADGSAVGLALLDELAAAGELQRYHLLHAARADFLARLDRSDEAAEAYRTALTLVGNQVERAFLERRLAEVEAAGAS